MTTTGGFWLVVAVLLPFVGMMLGLVLGGRNAARVAALAVAGNLAVAIAIARDVLSAPSVYLLGGWMPPLGVALRADGLSAAMLLLVAAVSVGIALYARRDFAKPTGVTEARAPLMFWLLLVAVLGSLNLIFVSGDLFTLYVGLELLTFAGVPLVCLDGGGETLRAALRYLLFALFGSLLYLLGAVLVYGNYGTLDIVLLAQLVRTDDTSFAILALMTVGLLAKTALFPLHIWLPPAHAGAPAAASAILSALVVKGSWFLVVRLWVDAMPGVATFGAVQLLGGLGAAAIVFGSIVAVRQRRLKLLVAYSTVAQIGYLFLMFPLAFDIATGTLLHGPALTAGALQAAAHASAKAGMFMAAGLIYVAYGHDRIADLGGAARAMPLTVLAFAIAGLALMGVLPSGAYLAKKLLLGLASSSGQWWWTVILQGGAAFTAAYLALVLTRLLRRPATAMPALKPVSRLSEIAALGLAIGSMALGFLAMVPATGMSAGLVSNPLGVSELIPTLLVTAAGFVLAAAFARQPLLAPETSAVRSLFGRAGNSFERADSVLRAWPVASLALLGIAGAFILLLRYGHAA